MKQPKLLSFETSKALYDAGLRLETENARPDMPELLEALPMWYGAGVFELSLSMTDEREYIAWYYDNVSMAPILQARHPHSVEALGLLLLKITKP